MMTFMSIFNTIWAGFLAAMFLASVARADCPEVEEVRDALRAYDNQEPIFQGLIYGSVAMLEIWASENEWTSVLVMPDGTACIMDEGARWRLLWGDPA